jgi:hypothetical protein
MSGRRRFRKAKFKKAWKRKFNRKERREHKDEKIILLRVELAQPMTPGRYRRYLERLPVFELKEKLRILQEEENKVSAGWKPGRQCEKQKAEIGKAETGAGKIGPAARHDLPHPGPLPKERGDGSAVQGVAGGVVELDDSINQRPNLGMAFVTSAATRTPGEGTGPTRFGLPDLGAILRAQLTTTNKL